MELADFVTQVNGFDKARPREKVKFFAWFLHAHRGKEVFHNTDIRACFSDLHMSDPNVSKYLLRMVKYGDLLKVRDGYKLGRAVKSTLDTKYGTHHTIVQVSKLLTELPGKVPDLAEKHFLAEAIKCYRIEAYRACVVMAWNLAYSHLLHWILNDAKRLGDFNSGISRRYPKKPRIIIAAYDHFLEELKESEVIEICNTAGHPAAVVIVQSQTDDVVTDLVNNVVLRLS